MIPRRFNENEDATCAGSDEAIRETDGDALTSRISAINSGYILDPYATLVAKVASSSTTRRAPLINVGTHHRTWALDRLVDSFLYGGDDSKPKQIVSLGAGSDTRFWRLMARERKPNISKYIEIDFPSVTSIKARRICMNRTLSSAVSPPAADGTTSKPVVSQGGSRLDTHLYTLLPLDLRIPDNEPVDSIPGEEGHPLGDKLSNLLDRDVPTLFLAECVYCYMQPEESERIMKWFAEHFGTRGGCVGILFEMCGLDDSFGTVMRRNLKTRNIQLPGAVFSNAQAYSDRYKKCGFEYAQGLDLTTIRRNYVPEEELVRISKLEMLDEVEELELMLSHYCVAWGSMGPIRSEIKLS